MDAVSVNIEVSLACERKKRWPITLKQLHAAADIREFIVIAPGDVEIGRPPCESTGSQSLVRVTSLSVI
jgi:hypothetical protein